MALFELDYFHGYIDVKECKNMLKDSGDFLLRHQFSHSVKSSEFECIVSVADEARIRTIGIHKSKKSSMFTIQGGHDKYPSVKAIVDHFLTSKKPIIDNVHLLKPIVRHAWELLNSQVVISTPEVQLGKGSFGTVLKGKLVGKESIDVAIKRLNEGAAEGQYAEAHQEARIMRCFDHKNLIKLHGVVIESIPIMLVIELIEGNSMSKMLKENLIPPNYRLSLVCGLLYGLSHVHDRGYIHRDVAARNVLVSHDCRDVKLIDFGLSRQGPNYEIQTPQKIPTKWLAPEVCHQQKFSYKSDVWAFGITVWEIYNDGAEPYPNKKNAEVRALLMDENKFEEVKPDFANVTGQEKPSADLISAMSSVFTFNVEARSSLNTLIPMFEIGVFNKLTGAQRDIVKAMQHKGQSVAEKTPAHHSAAGLISPVRSLSSAGKQLTPSRPRKGKKPGSLKPSTGAKKERTSRRKNKEK